jgi:hypothetical protein
MPRLGRGTRMTGKERILCALAGSIPDRVPVTIFVQQEFLSYYYRKNNPDRVKDAALLSAELGFDLMTRQRTHEEPHYTRKSFPNWEVSKHEKISDGNIHRYLEIETPGGRLSRIESAPYNPAIVEGIHFSTTKFMINTPEDFDLFRKYMPPVDKDYAEEMKEAALDAQKYIGNLGISCPWGTGGVFNAAAGLRDVSQLCTDPYEDEDFYHEFMEFLTSIDEVKAAVEELIAVCKPGGKYLFDTSDYMEPHTPLENVKAMIDTAIAWGKY